MDLGTDFLVAGLVVVGLASYFLFASFAFGAGYQPTPRRAVERMLDDARVGPNDVLYDLGAGTGAILFRAARARGARVVGVEVDPLRWLILGFRRRLGGPRDRVTIRWGNLYRTDFRPATVVAVFLWPEAMRRLRPLLVEQLRPGSRIVSHYHEIPGWTADSFDPKTQVYLYEWRGIERPPAAPREPEPPQR